MRVPLLGLGLGLGWECDGWEWTVTYALCVPGYTFVLLFIRFRFSVSLMDLSSLSFLFVRLGPTDQLHSLARYYPHVMPLFVFCSFLCFLMV